MIAIFCILGSAAGFFLSLNHGAIWPLAWIAPIPVLWLSFGQINRWLAFLSAWAAYALGSTNVLIAYGSEMPIPVLILATCAPALYFGLTSTLARLVARRIGPVAGAIAFGAIWTACDYLVSFLHDGTAPSPAYSQVGAPVLIQSASLFGLWVITFLLGFVPAALALSLRERKAVPAVVAIFVLALNFGYGEWRLVDSVDGAAVRIGLGSDDSISARATAGHPDRAADAAARYGAAAETLAHQGATLIVFPEKIARLSAVGRDAVIRTLRAAAPKAHATIVIGFDNRSAEPRNEAFVFTPDGAEPRIYFKRHFVRGLEDIFVPGDRVLSIGAKTDVEICKDMDFPRMLRADSRAQHPTLLLVPAWDFGADGWWHARLAIMRGVEDGFALARAAKDGLLTLSDAQGRVITSRVTASSGMVTLAGELNRGPGDTTYLHIGDVFAWTCATASLLLIGWASVRRK